ncbi:MAG: cation transporter [Deltaproteobacteria bacterium]|nr:MAG: cation transporter [Deltaproteobacteria bacterium]
MAHSNSSHVHHHSRTNAESLRVALAITSLVLVLEAVGGVLTGSVALLADAGHMLTDAGALGIALFAARISVRPRDAQKSFGYGRAEILAALANGLLLGGVSVGIALESFERLGTRHTIAAGPMIAIASIGLVANLVSAHFLSQTAKKNLNVRAALLHVLGDALSSVAAIVAGVLILFWNVVSADAIAGLVIAALLVASAFRLIRSSVDILLEGAPGHLDLRQIASEVRELPGVMDIHDLHIWTVSEGFLAMSAHVDLRTGANAETVRRAVHRLLHQGYNIMHTTIQTEEGPGLLSIEAEPNSS